MLLHLDHSFVKHLSKDLNLEELSKQTPRKVQKAHYSYTTPIQAKNPKILHYSEQVAKLINLSKEELPQKELENILSGNHILEKTQPYAMCYGGHQFGHWAGQLGDGRAMNLFQLKNQKNTYTLQLKGVGQTPYSRQGDGLAVLRSCIREHLCSEAMHYLGIPTTRSLAVLTTQEKVWRDPYYNGNHKQEARGISARVADSFIRFGNFEIFAARQDTKNLKKLADYVIKIHYKEIHQKYKDHPDKYIALFKEVCNKTTTLVTHWQRVGFVHGVMNTDNMSILGLTIDYGPFGWMEAYQPKWCANLSDTNLRYAFDQQSNIAFWNLVQLANALVLLNPNIKDFENILETQYNKHQKELLDMEHKKLGITNNNPESISLIYELKEMMIDSQIDFTLFYRKLCSVTSEFQWKSFLNQLKFCSYQELNNEKNLAKWQNWFKQYKQLIINQKISDQERNQKMKNTNPKYILRNYILEICIEESLKENYDMLYELHNFSKMPYKTNLKYQKWFKKRPDFTRQKTQYTRLSCSS